MNTPLDILEFIITNEDNDLNHLSKDKMVMLVFLRHFGCMICREALSDLAVIHSEIERKDVKLVLIHMSEYEIAETYFKKYNINKVEHVSDPNMTLYAHFGLLSGTTSQLYGLKPLPRMIKNTMKYGVTVNKKLGAIKQMPGVFLIENGVLIKRFAHDHIAVRPDYLAMIEKAQTALNAK